MESTTKKKKMERKRRNQLGKKVKLECKRRIVFCEVKGGKVLEDAEENVGQDNSIRKSFIRVILHLRHVKEIRFALLPARYLMYFD